MLKNRLFVFTSTMALALTQISPVSALSMNQVQQQNTTPLPNPDGYSAQQLLRLPAPAMGAGATVGGKLIFPRDGSLPMTGPLTAPVKAAGATTAVDLATRQSVLGFVSTDFGAKCDGITDDTTALRAFVAAAASLNVTAVANPPGKTCLVSTVGLASHTHLYFSAGGGWKGNGAKQNLVANYSFAYQTGSPETDITIDGPGTIDNAMPGGIGIAALAAVACIGMYGAVQNITVRDVTMQNCGAWPFSIAGNTTTPKAGAAHVLFENVKTLNSSNSPQFQGCEDCWARRFYSHNIGDYNFSFYSNVTNSGISEFNVDTGAGGVSVLNDGPGGGPTSAIDSNITIGPGFVTNEAGPCVYTQNNTTSGTRAQHQNVKVIGVHGLKCNTNGNTYWGGLTAQYVNGLHSIGNTWEQDGATTNTSANNNNYMTQSVAGELYDSTDSNVTSIGAQVYDEAFAGGSGFGIAASGVPSLTIIGLTTGNRATAKIMTNSIAGTAGTSTYISGGSNGTLAQNALQGFTLSSDTILVGVPGVATHFPSDLYAANGVFSGALTSGATNAAALYVGTNSGIRDSTNGSSTLYSDVSIGGTTGGAFTWRTTSGFTTIATMNLNGFTVPGKVAGGTAGSVGATSAGSFYGTGVAPTLAASTGTVASSTGYNDTHGTLTPSAAQTITVTFGNTAYTNPRDCVVSAQNGTVPAYSTTAKVLTITAASTAKISYQCMGS